MERTVQRHRKQRHPASPKKMSEVVAVFTQALIISMYGTTKSKQNPRPFFKTAYDGESFGYCVFSSDKSIDLMINRIPSNQRKLFVDATFKVRPHGDFAQLLILFVEFYKDVIPLVYVLMTRRTEAAYRHAFQFINDELFELNCQSIMSDFEIGMRNALRAVVPGIKVTGCWFHFCQALRRYAMKNLNYNIAEVIIMS